MSVLLRLLRFARPWSCRPGEDVSVPDCICFAVRCEPQSNDNRISQAEIARLQKSADCALPNVFTNATHEPHPALSSPDDSAACHLPFPAFLRSVVSNPPHVRILDNHAPFSHVGNWSFATSGISRSEVRALGNVGTRREKILKNDLSAARNPEQWCEWPWLTMRDTADKDDAQKPRRYDRDVDPKSPVEHAEILSCA